MGNERTTAETGSRADAPAPAPAAAGPCAPVPLPVVPAGPAAGPGAETTRTSGDRIGRLRRYTVEGAHKISANRSLAVGAANESKDLFALPAAIERSNRVLEGMRSQVKLVPGEDAPGALAGLKKVTPQNTSPEKALFDRSECIDVSSQVTNEGQTHAVFESAQDGASKRTPPLNPRELPQVNKVVETFAQNAGVGPQSATDALAALHDNNADESEYGYDFSVDGQHIQTDQMKEASAPLKARLPDINLRIALVKKVIDGYYLKDRKVQQGIIDYLLRFAEREPLPEVVDVDQAKTAVWETKILGWIDTDVMPPIKAARVESRRSNSAAYAHLDPQARGARAAKLGVNEFARPDVGESYGTLGTREPIQGEDDGKWTYHFAAVVARDGDDSVTLENYNRRDEAQGDGKWYFDMQGPLEQSFHAKHVDTVPDGMTVRMGQVATQDMRVDFVQRAEAKLGAPVPPDIAERMASARTRAELAALYAQALEGH